MITISNEEIFGKVVSDALVSVESKGLPSWEKVRCVNAIAKAAARIETSGCFMDYDAGEDRLLIWSDSNEIYEVGMNGRCQCKAQEHDFICWHRTAKRIIERYNEGMMKAFCSSAEFRRAEYARAA